MRVRIPDDPVLKAMQLAIEHQLEDTIQDIAKGTCKDFAEYKKKCGIVQGLEDSLGWLQVVIQEWNIEQDE